MHTMDFDGRMATFWTSIQDWTDAIGWPYFFTCDVAKYELSIFNQTDAT